MPWAHAPGMDGSVTKRNFNKLTKGHELNHDIICASRVEFEFPAHDLRIAWKGEVQEVVAAVSNRPRSHISQIPGQPEFELSLEVYLRLVLPSSFHRRTKCRTTVYDQKN